jgi:hypothetical protein
MLDIAALAHQLVTFLAPFLPFLKQAGGKVAEEAGKKLGEGAFDRAKTLWGKLSPHVKKKEAAQEAVQDLATRPEDARARGAVELQVEKILAAEPALAGELAELLKAAGPRATWVQAGANSAVAVGDGSVAASSGGVAVGGDLNLGARTRGTKGTGSDE